MRKIFFLIIVFMQSLVVSAHGVDISSMVLVEQDDNTWTLQIRASLDAFRKEVKCHFADNPYKTPEEFTVQLLAHFKNNLKISVNNEQSLFLSKPQVQLGHETLVFYSDIALPEDLESIKIFGPMFKDIFNSKVKLLILKKGYDKKPFILNKKNNYTVDIRLKENKFILNAKKDSTTSYLLPILGLFMVVVLVSFMFFKKSKLWGRFKS